MAGFGMRVIGTKELNAQFGRISDSFAPPQTAKLVRVGAEVIADAARENIVEQKLVDTGDLYESVKVVGLNQYSAGVKVDSVYGATHEFGLEKQPITDRQRRFFWARYAETKDRMWLALALSVTYTIPARPYLRPAADEKKDDATFAIMHEAVRRLRRAAR